MSCSTPPNRFKPENPFTPASDSSPDLSLNYFGSSSRRFHSANPFASQNELDNFPTDLFTHHRKFLKPAKNPADYDGTQSLRDYLKHFERCFVVNGWSKDEAAVFWAASLRGEAQKVLNGMSDSDCRNYAKIVDKLELPFGVENSASYTRPVCTTVANRKMKVFKPFLQISGLCQLSLVGICPLTLRKDLPSRISLMLSKIETTGFDYTETNHAPWTKPCCWPVNFVSWIEIGQEALQRFSLSMKFKASLICFKLSLKRYGLTFKHNNNLRRLSKLFSNS